MKTILVISAEYKTRQTAKATLETAGYKVVAADNGKDGVREALLDNPDVIICDSQLNALDGFSVLHLIKKNHLLYSTPFIMMVDGFDRIVQRKAMDTGADDVIYKPVKPQELLKAVEARLMSVEKFRQNFNTAKTPVEKIAKVLEHANEMGLISLVTGEHIITSMARNSVVYKRGQNPRYLYFVQSGRVKVYKTDDNGNELITGISIEGDFIGYQALLQGTKYDESADTIEDSQIMAIPKDDFLTMVYSGNHITRALLKLLAKNVAEKEEKLIRMAYDGLHQRVANSLLYACEKAKNAKNHNGWFEIGRKDLAKLAGTSPESVSRALTIFKNEKLIDMNDGQTRLLYENKLRNFTSLSPEDEKITT